MKKQNEKVNASKATFEINGEVIDVYNGKTNDYATVKVQEQGEKYYNTFRVAVSPNVGIEIGDNVSISGRISTFWNNQYNRSEIVFTAVNVENIIV